MLVTSRVTILVTYARDFEGNYARDFEGNYLGTEIGSSTSVIETYTLYVRTA